MEYPVNSVRRYELDWLRVFAVLLLLFFHTGMIFGTWPWLFKNNETCTTCMFWMIFLRSWRMPLLFFVAGAGTYFAMGKLRPFQYLVERFKRLILPLIFAMLTLLPVQTYYEHIIDFSSFWDFYKSGWNFISHYHGRFHLHHLWFIGNLFMYSLIGIPVLRVLHSKQMHNVMTKVITQFFRPAVILFIPPLVMIATQLILLPDHQGRAYFVYYLLFFLFGMICYCFPEHTNEIRANRKFFLGASILALIALAISYIYYESKYLATSKPVDPVLVSVEVFVSWFLVITIVGFAQHYLIRPHSWLSLLNQGAYPFYILHQTAIVAFGYNICQLPLSIAAKYWSIILLTLVSCVLFYLLCIRPFNLMRFFFGLRPKRPR